MQSYPTRVRELKCADNMLLLINRLSHPSWVRELK